MPTIVLVIGVASILPATAFYDLGLDIGDFEGEGWSLQGATVQTRLNSAGRLEVTLKIKRILLLNQIAPIEDLVMTCPELVLSSQSARCVTGHMRLSHPRIRPERFAISLECNFNGSVKLACEDLRLNEGGVAGRLQWDEASWWVRVRGDALGLAPWVKDLTRVYPEVDLAVTGTADLVAKIAGDKHDVRSVDLEIDSKGLAFTDSASLRVGEDVELKMRFNAQQQRGEWLVDTAIALDRGQVYLEPIYLDFKDHRIHAQAEGIWRAATRRLEIKRLSYDDRATVRLSAEANVVLARPPELVSMDLKLTQAKFPKLYDGYLQPVFIGSSLDNLETSGQLTGRIRYRKNQSTRIDLQLDDLSLDDARGRFGLYDLQGKVRWHNRDEPLSSTLGFSGGHVYRVGLGRSELQLESGNREVRLLKPTIVPVLDGTLLVETFDLRDVAPTGVEWQFDASLTPISMESFTAALGWPAMLGELSGSIPGVRYRGGELTVGGGLLVRVFDGTITVNNLRLQHPLGPVPQLHADAVIDNLDLNTLTRTFSFGKIEGRLGGHVRGLELVNWEPVQFDAVIETPKDDRSRHRISQRAVDNLTSLSGGVTGVLSTGFLGFFEDFAYDRIGVSCRLSNGVCEMDGVAPAKDGGYYIVTGAGLPRIDVIGHSHHVDWLELLHRLKSVSLDSDPVID